MKFLQVGNTFTQISDRCVIMLKREEGTTVAGGVTWSLGVAVELMETTKSGVHEGLTLGRTQGGGQYSPRWSLLCLCRILCTSWVTLGLGVVLGVDRIRVVSESNSCTLGLPYNEGSTTRVTYDDLIAAGAQGEPAACAGDQGGRCSGISGEERP